MECLLSVEGADNVLAISDGGVVKCGCRSGYETRNHSENFSTESCTPKPQPKLQSPAGSGTADRTASQ